MLKSKGKTCMVKEPSHVKQLSLNHVCKIGLKYTKTGTQAYLKNETKNSENILHCLLKNCRDKTREKLIQIIKCHFKWSVYKNNMAQWEHLCQVIGL
jgi:hypothetical protein